MLPVIIVTGLIFWDNFSTAALLFTTSFVLIFIGRVKLTYILGMIGIGLVLLVLGLTLMYNLPEGQQGRLGTWKTG